jgi:nitrogen regulatory protein PII-like uncharacterized protein
MFAKTVTYTDYNNVERTETFYFNLTKAEVLEMELGTTGGLSAMIQGVIDAKDTPQLIKIFKDLVLKAYGEKSADGRRFIKSKELSEAFSQTEAYSNLYMELITDADAAAVFINGIVPEDVAMAAEQRRKANEKTEESNPVDNKIVEMPVTKEENKVDDGQAHLLETK